MSAEGTTDPVGELLAALRIERGNPGPEELAALTVVLTHLSAAAPGAALDEVPLPRSHWVDRRHALGLAPVPGPGGWRASALPR